jgi:hypothetical protein
MLIRPNGDIPVSQSQSPASVPCPAYWRLTSARNMLL